MNTPGYLEVSCPCTQCFEVPESLKAGLTNCPRCGKAVRVPGGPEAVFWVLLGLSVAAALGIGGAVWLFAGATAGLVVLGIEGVLIAIVVIAS